VRDAERVHLVLKDDAVVDAVIASARPGMRADAILIDHSTTLPELTAQRAARLAAEGLRFLHCPVFMTPLAARNAKGSMLAAGPRAIFDAVKDELAAMTGRLEYQGERSDLAAAKKLLGNALILSLVGTLADVMTLAQATGVDAREAIDLMPGFSTSTPWWPRAAPAWRKAISRPASSWPWRARISD
jgi:3-hydroxyisobutyrate dehydrogenase